MPEGPGSWRLSHSGPPHKASPASSADGTISTVGPDDELDGEETFCRAFAVRSATFSEPLADPRKKQRPAQTTGEGGEVSSRAGRYGGPSRPARPAGMTGGPTN